MTTRNYEEPTIPGIIADKTKGTLYTKGKFFGKGGFARCYEIRENKTGNSYAGKIVSKKLLMKSNQKEKMVQEITIHKNINHRNIVKFYNNFEDENFVYVVLELCHKRSLMELHRRRKALTEPETRYYMKQILEGVLYLHDNGIIHRDLKLGNLFLSEDIEVKIGDFGLAAKIEYEGQRKRTLCGTPNYIAPEILNKKGHSFEVDIWSVGCILYTLLVGSPPFETNSLKETYEKIKRCDYKMPHTVKHPAANLISQMLQPDPKKRPNVREILNSEFFVNGYCPLSLPLSALTIPPRFDTVTCSKTTHASLRKPLLEVNDNSPIPSQKNILKRRNDDGKINTSGKDTPINTAIDCMHYLTELRSQLQNVIQKKHLKNVLDLEEMTDPASQPLLWISRWVDYSDKYGFGYQLCDEGFGVMFNDNTRILLHPNQKDVHYINQDGNEFYYVIDDTPAYLEKKVKLLNYFRRYMNDHLMKAGSSIQVLEADKLCRIPYLHQWRRSNTSVFMQLTNGTVQINFMDHSKIIMCPLMGAVTHIDVKKTFRTYKFTTIMKNGCSDELLKSLKYAYSQIYNMCPKMAEDVAIQ